jgi:hypothetical protein
MNANVSQKRRLYDVINILESVGVMSKISVDTYIYSGTSRITEELGKLAFLDNDSVELTEKGLYFYI